MDSPSYINYFFNAGPMVKLVMLILLAASVMSWTYIIQRWVFLRKAKQSMLDFETEFWSGNDLTKLFARMQNDSQAQGLASIFRSGFNEFIQYNNQSSEKSQGLLETVQRAMRISNAKETERLNAHIPFLATIGSTSPYIGLFGTVWGIMTSFHALGNAKHVTMAMVAPGISEALIATAMGLFAAIPAVIAYNRFSNHIETLQNQYEIFQEEFSNILVRRYDQAQAQVT